MHVQEGLGQDPGSGNLQDFMRTVLGKVNGVPFVALLVGLAGSLLGLGLTIGSLLVPGSSQVAGYFIGSLLIGFVFVFPISAIVLSVKAARSHRSPRLLGLIPVATIWVAALATLLANGIVFFVPAPLVEAVLFLLIASNVILMPLVFSVALAKFVA